MTEQNTGTFGVVSVKNIKKLNSPKADGSGNKNEHYLLLNPKLNKISRGLFRIILIRIKGHQSEYISCESGRLKN